MKFFLDFVWLVKHLADATHEGIFVVGALLLPLGDVGHGVIVVATLIEARLLGSLLTLQLVE